MSTLEHISYRRASLELRRRADGPLVRFARGLQCISERYPLVRVMWEEFSEMCRYSSLLTLVIWWMAINALHKMHYPKRFFAAMCDGSLGCLRVLGPPSAIHYLFGVFVPVRHTNRTHLARLRVPRHFPRYISEHIFVFFRPTS